jgi:hypothetical protein
MDKVRLNYRAKDQIQPELQDLSDALDRLAMLPDDFEGKHKVRRSSPLLSRSSSSSYLPP